MREFRTGLLARFARWAGSGALLFALLAVWTPCADAAAWNEPAGQGTLILRGTFDAGRESFDIHGKPVRTPSYTKREVSAYLQYGVTDWLQVILKPDLVSTSLAGTPGGHYLGAGTSEAGAQLRLLMFGPAVLAVQGTFHLPYTTRQSNLALIGNTSRDTDGRLLLGVSIDALPWPSFVDAELGYRVRGAHAPDELHLDATFGTRPLPRLLLLAQAFTTVPTQPSAPWFPRSRYTNLEGSVVYDLSDRWSVQFGLFTTVAGRNALRERGAETSLWYRF